MTIKAGAKRCFRSAGDMDNVGDRALVSMPHRVPIMFRDLTILLKWDVIGPLH